MSERASGMGVRGWIERRRDHPGRLEDIENRVAVVGVGGTRIATRLLAKALSDRDLDAYAMLGGDSPVSVYGGFEFALGGSDGERTRTGDGFESRSGLPTADVLTELERSAPEDAFLIENVAIEEYDTRQVNERLARADTVLVTDSGLDGIGPLGETRDEIARSIARTVPVGTDVFAPVSDHVVRRRLETELARRDASLEFVSIPSEYTDVPGSECVYGVDAILNHLDGSSLDADEISEEVDAVAPRWHGSGPTRIGVFPDYPGVEGADTLRRYLCAEDVVFRPLVCLRSDRRGRAAAFATYLDRLAEAGLISDAWLVGDPSSAVQRSVSIPTERYDPDIDARDLLSIALDGETPVLVMGETRSNLARDFARTLRRETRDVDTITRVSYPVGGNG